MDVEFHIQDPDDPGGVYLLEAILRASEGANRGAASFAFASRNGAKLLLLDSAFTGFLKTSPFHLVIGLDAVTNEASLQAIAQAQALLPKLKTSAFLHDRPGILFHPKMCWFANESGGTLIVGSGNLTGGGFRDNWESFTVTPLDVGQVKNIEDHWNAWLTRHANSLLPLDDPRVTARASKNIHWQVPGDGKGHPGSEEEDDILPSSTQSPAVLVAEVPAGGDRWYQANFDLATFNQFFDASPAKSTRVFLQEVLADGALAPTESRPSVSVKSSNYRFELNAGKGKPYPAAGRPIAVFVRVAKRQYRYKLVMPGEADHSKLDAFLAAVWKGPASRMRRIITSADVLRKDWPNTLFWDATIQATQPAAI